MKELLQEINTSCKDCVFATWEEDTQVGCDLGKIKLYKERKTPIIEAFDDEDKEFFVVKAWCSTYREESFTVLKHWVKKIRHKGKIVVTSVDTHQVCKSFLDKEIDIDQFNKIVHGTFQAPWDVRLSHSSLEELAEFLTSLGLIVTKKRISGIRAILEATRP